MKWTISEEMGAYLDDAEMARAEALLKLRNLALECEQHYGREIDIEWAFRGDDLYLLQCRAITRTSP